jgi:hypothetical protein
MRGGDGGLAAGALSPTLRVWWLLRLLQLVQLVLVPVWLTWWQLRRSWARAVGEALRRLRSSRLLCGAARGRREADVRLEGQLAGRATVLSGRDCVVVRARVVA